RKRLLAALAADDPELHERFLEGKWKTDGSRVLVRESGRFPLYGRGRVNAYSVFGDTNRQILAPRGRMGIIVPSGIATDSTTQYFFQDLMESEALVSLYDFENREKLFPAVDSRVNFCLLTVAGAA